jgi:hypothetical protein
VILRASQACKPQCQFFFQDLKGVEKSWGEFQVIPHSNGLLAIWLETEVNPIHFLKLHFLYDFYLLKSSCSFAPVGGCSFKIPITVL